jgi:HSP90 family molecular chaperone
MQSSRAGWAASAVPTKLSAVSNMQDTRSIGMQKRYFSESAKAAETMEFQAETRKLLDIVTNSIYTDKEVFVRELVSNASDALEKIRYSNVSGGDAAGEVEAPLEISLTTPDPNTLIIQDSGVGMSKEEMVKNLGTIARSGSKEFVENMKDDTASGIIGQFGVGFYSSFMVAEKVVVESKPSGAATAFKWSSDGSGVFTIEECEAEDLARGTRITMHLKEKSNEFANGTRIKDIIKKYSNFVNFPIKLNGEAINTVSALWTKDQKKISLQEYKEFYRFCTNAYDDPKYIAHFKTDAPLDLKCLFFVPTFHSEKFGASRMAPGVDIYSKKVLIESKPKDLLPDWLRFLKGVIDSEDLPLSISREKPQDTQLIRRIGDVVTRKILRFFETQLKDDRTTFVEFYNEYAFFLKEGSVSDAKFGPQISKVLMYESSALEDGALTTFDEYISRCPPEQKQIYYITGSTREACLNSPYYEQFSKHKKEVLFFYNSIDDFVAGNLKTHGGREIISGENSNIDLGPLPEDEDTDEPKDAEFDEDDADKKKKASALSNEEAAELCLWISTELGDKKVRQVKVTDRLYGSPAIITDHESGAVRRMLKMMEQAQVGKKADDLPPQILEINPKHPIITGIFKAMRSSDGTKKALGKMVAEQVFDNAIMAAGLMDEPKSMLQRLNAILETTIDK